MGEGANQSGRVQWMKNLPSKEVDYFISEDFISKDGWLKKQPWYIERFRQPIADRLSD